MSIIVKATIFFASDDNEGWSESWYMSATNIADAQAQLDIIVPLRSDFLSVDSSIIYARVSDVAIKGDSLLTTVALPDIGGWNPAGSSPLEANSALLYEILASSVEKNRMFLRGMRSSEITGREYTPSVGWAAAVAPWQAALASANQQVRTRATIGPPPTYTYAAAVSSQIVKATARKPGRPFGLPVGRR